MSLVKYSLSHRLGMLHNHNSILIRVQGQRRQKKSNMGADTVKSQQSTKKVSKASQLQ